MMICPKCYSKLPNDSEFCQYCGIKIDRTDVYSNGTYNGTPVSSKDTVNHKGISLLAHFKDAIRGTDLSGDAPSNYSETRNSSTKKTKKWLKWVAICLIFALVALNTYQYFCSVELRNELSTLETEITTLKSDKESLNQQITTLKSDKESLDQQISSLKSDKSDLQSQVSALKSNKTTAINIYNTLKSFSYGTKYSDYYSNTEVLVVKAGDTKSLNITFDVTKSSTVYFQSNNSLSTAEWGKNWSGQTCAVKVTGKTAGTTTYTFTNDYNSHSFKVLVIILPKS